MKEADREGLQNAARFAIQPNMWGFCGEDECQEILRNFVTEKSDNSELVRVTLHEHGFPHLNSFLESIAIKTGLDLFNEEVVLSYWLGGPLTEEVGVDNKAVLAECYRKQISPEFGNQLEKVLPEKIYLTHLSQVALVAAADYQGAEKTNLINHCMIAFGRVLELDSKNRMAVVEREVLKKTDSGYKVVANKQKVKIDADLTPEIKKGDEVTIHLGYLSSRINQEMADRLKFWTRKVAEIL
ncbi:MAG TPA: DUF6390 family protein [Patescibacteria group bacterium]